MICPYCGTRLVSTATEGWSLVVSTAMVHMRQECSQRRSDSDPVALQHLAEEIADEAVAMLWDDPRE
jgi:hypothetical protein